MKTVIAMLVFVSLSQAQAQTNVGTIQGGGEAVVVPVQTVGAQPQVVEVAQPAASQPAAGQGNPIYILNSQRVNQAAKQAAVQEQPVSVVQDTPLKASAADSMRKKRQETESATEDGIVQALERARMEDEIKRRDRFNNAIGPSDNSQVAQQPPVSQPQVIPPQAQTVQTVPVVVLQQPAPQPVQQVAPAPVAAPVQKINVVEDDARDVKDDKVDIRSEIRAAIEDSKKSVEDQPKYYVSGLASFGNYNNVINVDRSLGWGFAVGTQTTDRIIAEGSFIYGDYQLEDVYRGVYTSGGYYPFVVDMRQYNIGAAVKYALLTGKFKPVVGPVLSYTRRSYNFQGDEFRTSDAVDAGGLVGADLQLNDSLAIGLDFRYMTNLGYRQNVAPSQSFVYSQQRNDPERLDYYTLNVLAKFLF